MINEKKNTKIMKIIYIYLLIYKIILCWYKKKI